MIRGLRWRHSRLLGPVGRRWPYLTRLLAASRWCASYRDLRIPAVDDHDDHGQGASGCASTSLSETITCNCPGRFDDVGGAGAGGSQRGRDPRILLRADDEGSRDPLRRGKDRQLGTESRARGSEERDRTVNDHLSF